MRFFWTRIQLLLLSLPFGHYSTYLSRFDEKIKLTKIPHFFDFFDNFSQISLFWVFFSHSYPYYYKPIFTRQTFCSIIGRSQKPTIWKKKQKNCKKCQKSWLFEKSWLLWLLTSQVFLTCPTVSGKCPLVNKKHNST